jgi:hypothetical protein
MRSRTNENHGIRMAFKDGIWVQPWSTTDVYQCYVATTQAGRVSDTVEFFPRESTTPALSALEAAIVAAKALTQVLHNPPVSTTNAHTFATATSALQQKGTDTIKFMHGNELPADQQPSYPRFVCTERPQKEEKFRTQMTVGGNLIDYPGDISVGTVEMETIKMLLNGVVSTPGAQFCSADVTNFYLNMPMDRHEFVRIPINLIPNEIVQVSAPQPGRQ